MRFARKIVSFLFLTVVFFAPALRAQKAEALVVPVVPSYVSGMHQASMSNSNG
jgi:hypothetical protein